MPELACYRLRNVVEGEPATDFGDFVDREGRSLIESGPIQAPDFEAMVYVSAHRRRDPPWASFLRQGFGEELELAAISTSSALLIVRIRDGGDDEYFGFPFGAGGRFLLREAAYERGYGLRSALNLIYPVGADTEPDLARLRTVDAKRRGANIVRTRHQSARTTTFETFGLDRLRDVVKAAGGRPAHERWGTRVSGADALHIAPDIRFSGLGSLCREIDEAHARTDYQERFRWLDNMQPVTDPVLVSRLESLALTMLRQGTSADLELAPPEVIDWNRVVSFRYHFDAGRDVRHPDLRLEDYLAGLRHAGRLEDLDAAALRRWQVSALDGDGSVVHRWSVWRCLTGELALDGTTYVLDEAELVTVARDFMDGLDAEILAIPESNIGLPIADPMMREAQYNEFATRELGASLLLDQQLVRVSSSTTPIELCDILTADRRLIHVKRHLGSRDLSHLFAQGVVSAELLQSDREFRSAVHHRVRGLPGGDGFGFFEFDGIITSRFEVVFAVIANWYGRSLAEGLPFFSKVNLRRSVNELANRGYRVSFARVEIGQA